MDDKTVTTARRSIIIILFLSILCLILISFLPWIAVAENGSVTENLHFNYEMMKDSSNIQINGLLNSLMDIYILFWSVIIISLISFIFIIVYTMVKRTLFFRILFLTSSFILFLLIIFIIYFQIIFSRTINEIDNISASMIYPPFAYAYIQFILSIILLVFSGSYAIYIIKDSKKQFKSQQNQKKEKKRKNKEKISDDIEIEKEIEKSIKLPGKTDSLNDTKREDKFAEIDKLLAKKESVKINQKPDEKSPKKEKDIQTQYNLEPEKDINIVEEEINIEPVQEIEQKENDNVQIKHPFPEKKPNREIDKSDELKLSEHFEKVLSNAIEKKQSEINPKKQEEKEIIKEKKGEPEQIDIDKQTIEPDIQSDKKEKKVDKTRKILNVKCPECNHIFTFNKEDYSKKIICPKCGKEGEVEIKI